MQMMMIFEVASIAILQTINYVLFLFLYLTFLLKLKLFFFFTITFTNITKALFSDTVIYGQLSRL